jgi:hypothetical protein
MRNRLALVTVLAVLVGGALVAPMVAAAASPGGASTLRPWGKGHASAQAGQAAPQAAAGASSPSRVSG